MFGAKPLGERDVGGALLVTIQVGDVIEDLDLLVAV